MLMTLPPMLRALQHWSLLEALRCVTTLPLLREEKLLMHAMRR